MAGSLADAFKIGAPGLVVEAKRRELINSVRWNLGQKTLKRVQMRICKINNLDELEQGIRLVRRVKRSSQDFYRAKDFLAA